MGINTHNTKVGIPRPRCTTRDRKLGGSKMITSTGGRAGRGRDWWVGVSMVVAWRQGGLQDAPMEAAGSR